MYIGISSTGEMCMRAGGFHTTPFLNRRSILSHDPSPTAMFARAHSTSRYGTGKILAVRCEGVSFRCDESTLSRSCWWMGCTSEKHAGELLKIVFFCKFP